MRRPLLFMLVAFTLFSFICVHPVHSFAEYWGAYMLSPVSAPALALEAVGAGTSEGTAAAIDRPNGMPNQKWFIIPKGNNFYSIRPAYSSTLVLAAAKGGTANGTAIVLETDKGEPWQKWMIKRNENGVYNLIPGHAPDKGIDDLGGNQKPGTRQDLWTNTPGDQHLQWLIKPLAGTLSPDTNGASSRDTSAYIAPDIKPELVLKGEIKSTSFTRSSIFSGTVRQVTVFIPAQYKGSQPACVYVKTDGYNPREKQLLETLIATGEMPVTIGVFVSPGDLPAATVNNLLVNTSGKTIEKKNTLGRRNRDFEYDAVGDNNVRFLIEEILPFVAKEYGLKLSASGNDRCIAGGSSGGIAAFDAAWERPDAFSRVYANSGSFVAFRGGHEFPTLVRKFEAKPIRAYLTTGTNDMENCAGDWFLLAQWLLTVAEGHSKWADSYQMNPDGSLTNQERYFWLHVPDWEDNAGAESVCYAREGQMLVATRFGIQVCADDGPTQVILPMPDRRRVIGVCLGGRDLDTLYAFCGSKIWKRKVKIHAIGAFTPWTAIHGTPL